MSTPKLKTASRFGGQVGEVKAQILRYLSAGKRNRFDIAMHINHGRAEQLTSAKISAHLGAMVTADMIVHIKDGVFEGYRIANHGRKAIGEEVQAQPYNPTRICNSMMPNCPDLNRYTGSGRVGLAVYR